MSVSDPQPDPSNTPGLEPGGGIAPGDTPPAADQDRAVATDRARVPNQGPVGGSRTPAALALGVVALVVVVVVVGGIALAVGL